MDISDKSVSTDTTSLSIEPSISIDSSPSASIKETITSSPLPNSPSSSSLTKLVNTDKVVEDEVDNDTSSPQTPILNPLPPPKYTFISIFLNLCIILYLLEADPNLLSSALHFLSSSNHNATIHRAKSPYLIFNDSYDYGEQECGRNFRYAALTADVLPYCQDTLASLRYGYHPYFNSPFSPYNKDKDEYCTFHWYNPDEVCNIIQQSGRYISFIGDSFMRHIGQSFYILMSNNYKNGGMLLDKMPSDDLKEHCICDVQYYENTGPVKCRFYSAAGYTGNQSIYCPNWYNKNISYLGHDLGWYHGTIFEQYKESFEKDVIQYIQNNYHGKGLILVNIGLHNNLLSSVVFPQVYQYIFDMIKKYNLQSSIEVICITVNLPHENQPDEFKPTQGLPLILNIIMNYTNFVNRIRMVMY